MSRCTICGKILSNENQEQRCLMTVTIQDTNGNILSSATGRTIGSGIKKAATISQLNGKNYKRVKSASAIITVDLRDETL